jgi:cysteine desulfurase
VGAYLYHAATTPVWPEVEAAMVPFLGARFGNASEPHAAGRDAAAALARAREEVAAALGAEPAQVVFTSGGTEADNQAVFGLAGEPPGRLVVSAIEHPAVREAALRLERRGFEVAWAPVDGDGVVDAEAFAALVRPGDRLAAVMWANNVTGVVQPVAALAVVAAERGVPFHADAVQAAPSLPVSLAPGVETLAVSAHKLHGPKGAGCLVAREPRRLPPLLAGGGQEGGLRPGTENVAGAVGLAAALAAVRARRDDRATLRDLLERRAAAAGALPLGVRAPRLPSHSLLHCPGVRADLLVLALDRAGYAVAAGSACASGEPAPSHVLLAQGLDPAAARSALRVTLGLDTTAPDVHGFCDALETALADLRTGALVA